MCIRDRAISIIEISLRQTIELWKERNDAVHADDNIQEQQHALEHLKDKVQKLMEKQPDCRPSDHYLFPENPKEFISTSQAPRLTRWMITTQRAIKNSMLQAAKEASTRTRNIRTWFQPTQQPIVQHQKVRTHDRLRHDSYSKKKRHKPDRSLQTNRIDRYCLSLRNIT